MLRIHIFAAAALLVFSGPALADYVGGLDPDGDNYLSLRSGPGSKYDELQRIGPDTVVTVIESAQVGGGFNWRMEPRVGPSGNTSAMACRPLPQKQCRRLPGFRPMKISAAIS